jgi:hypothetical protein
MDEGRAPSASSVRMWPGWVNVPFSREQLVAELSSSLRAAWAEYRARHPRETPYAFGLWVVSEDGWIVASAYATEESVTERAAQYAYMLSGDDRARAEVIRWWDADWVHCNDLRPQFCQSNELLAELARAESVYLDARENAEVRRRRSAVAELHAMREEIYLAALAELHLAALGGPSAEVVVGVFGADPDRTARSIARLNPPALVERWRREVDAGERAYAALQR